MDQWSIIGFTSRSGEFEGKSYDNILIHCVRKAKNEYETGDVCETFKMRRSDFEDGKSVSLGDLVTPYYDRFGRVVALV